jgi:hypothetical protein
MLVLHPTVAFKAYFAVLWTVLPASIWNNTIYFGTMEELKRFLGSVDFRFPQCIHKYEAEQNASIFGSLW